MIRIQVLGTGCPKCKKMAEVAESAAGEMGMEFELEKVTDLNQIMSFGVMITPALVVNGQVKIAGKVPSPDDMKKMFA
ncbi:MAG: thioredoxin family protein [Candidatus Fermentibacteria bacterium]|nr:thioredoxin family protein [Candidatus Fermentibacteria bacterium]